MTFDNCVVVGATGRLGAALLGSAGGRSIHAPSRELYSTWVNTGAVDDYLRRLSERTVIHVAAGVVDPNASRDLLEAINISLPAEIARCAADNGHRLVTYGSVMEQLLSSRQMNPYIESKVELCNRLETLGNTRGLDFVHLRLHTLYGGNRPPAPFMFAGLMFDSLASGRRFKMTGGHQYREYHHVDDETVGIERIVDQWSSGTYELSNGMPVRLRDLAVAVFEAFGARKLLSIGAIPDPEADYYEPRVDISATFSDIGFRDPLCGLPQWFQQLGAPSHRHPGVKDTQ